MSKTTLQVIFKPKVEGAHNYDLIIDVDGTQEKVALKAISTKEHRKSLQPFASQLVSEYINELHPKYVEFITEFFKFLEQKNHNKYFSSNEEQWSLYNSIMDIMLFADFNTLPIEHLKLLEAFFSDYAASYDFTNLVVDLDDEKLRKLGLSANLITRLKCTWKAYNFYMATINEYYLLGERKTIALYAYYVNSIDVSVPPDHSAIGDHDVILSELPIYSFNTATDAIDTNATITADPNTYKGKYPFEYQLISKSRLMSSSTFVSNLINNCNPAGFFANFIYTPPEIGNATCYIAGGNFPKVIIDMSSIEAIGDAIREYYNGAGILPGQYSYAGGAHSPNQDRIYLAPYDEADSSIWHYIDCATGNVVEYIHGASVFNLGYIGAVYSPNQDRIYLAPSEQASKTNWHYIDCVTGNVVAYAHGITAVTDGYHGGVYSPNQDRIYFAPNYQSGQSQWHYIDCTTGNVVAYTHGATVTTVAYEGAVYSPNQDRIYLVPYEQSDETNWHYIDCATGNVVAYTHGSSCTANLAYIGGAYSPNQDRIYFAPNYIANQPQWNYIDCATGNVGNYTHGAVLSTRAYSGAVYHPQKDRIYFIPYAQSDDEYWHYIDCNDGTLNGYEHGFGTSLPYYAYYDGVYSLTQNKIYFVSHLIAHEGLWHYLGKPIYNWTKEDVDYSSPNYPSNYPDNADNTVTITKAGATRIMVHFDVFFVENNYDFVYIKDSTDTTIRTLTGNLGDFYSVAVSGDTIKINLVSDSSVNEIGYHIDEIIWQ